METATEIMRNRLGRIGMLELMMFLLSCLVHYYAFKSRGGIPFSSDLNILFFLSWSGIAIVMLYTAHLLKAHPDIPPRLIMTVSLVYVVQVVFWAVSTVPMLFNGRIPLLVKAVGPLPWLLLRGWFVWLLLDGALKLLKPEKSEI